MFRLMMPSLTVTVMLLLTGAAVVVTVMVAVPLPCAVTRPLASTLILPDGAGHGQRVGVVVFFFTPPNDLF